MAIAGGYGGPPPVRQTTELVTSSAVVIVGSVALLFGIAGFMVSPKIGLATLGLPLIPLLVIAPAKALLLFFAALPFDSIASLGARGAATLTRLLALAVSAGWILSMILRRQRPRFDVPGYLLLAYLAFAAVSSIWAEDPSRAVDQLMVVAQLFVLYLMIVNLLTSPVAIERAVNVLLVATVAVAVLVTWQFPSVEAVERGAIRATVGFGDQKFDPNGLAATLVIPALGAAALGRARGRLGIWRLAAPLPLGVAAIMTGSRGGALALGVGLVVLAALQPRFRGRLLAFVICTLVSLVIVMPSGSLERLQQRYQHSVEDRGAGRLDIWTVGVSMIRDKPLRGTGYAGFGPAFYRYMLTSKVDPGWASSLINRYGGRGAHNIYLAAIAELGIFGAGLFFAALVAHLLSVWRAFRATRRAGQQGEARLALAVLSMLIGLLVVGFNLDTSLDKLAWVVLALAHAAGPALAPVDRSHIS